MDREFEASFDSHGHLDLPREVREKHGFRNGSRVTIEDRQKEVVLKPAPDTKKWNRDRMKEAIEQSVGMLGNDKAMFDAFLEDKKEEREREDRDLHS